MNYLVSRGLLTSDRIIAEGVSVVHSPGKNGGLLVTTSRGGFFLKQGVDWHAWSDVKRESEIYARLWESFADRPPFAPATYGFDELKGVLVLEAKDEAVALAEQFTRRGRLGPAIAGAIGGLLAQLHCSAWDSPPVAVARSQLDGVAELSPLPVNGLPSWTPGGRELVRLVQRHPRLTQEALRLQAEWRASHIVHADLRWTNVLLADPGAFSRNPRLILIDWETAGLGDPCWDVGCIFANFLTSWVDSMPLSSKIPLRESINLARSPLAKFGPPAIRFWSRYCGGMNLPASERLEWLERSARYCSIRLVQSAIESCQSASTLSNREAILLQLAMNISDAPLEAMQDLLGLAA